MLLESCQTYLPEFGWFLCGIVKYPSQLVTNLSHIRNFNNQSK